MLYTHNDQLGDPTISKAEEAALEVLIKKILADFKTVSHDRHPELFTNLVHALRKLGYSQLTKIFSAVTDAAAKR